MLKLIHFVDHIAKEQPCAENLCEIKGVLGEDHFKRVRHILEHEMGLDDTVILLAARHHHDNPRKIASIGTNDSEKFFAKEASTIVAACQESARFRNFGFRVKHREDGQLLLQLFIKELVEQYPDYSDRIIRLKIALSLDTIRNLDKLEEANLAPDTVRNLKRTLASEALYVWAPLAKFYGHARIYEELSCLAFAETRPGVYQETLNAINASVGTPEETKEKLLSYMSRLEKQIQSTYPQLKIKIIGAEDKPDFEEIARLSKSGHIAIYGNRKSPYETDRKIKEKDIDLKALSFDLARMRIIVPESISQTSGAKFCSDLTELIRACSTSYDPDRHKDYIAQPKASSYQSIHHAIFYQGIHFECQVRTLSMHENAERGRAAHMLYRYRLEDGASLVDSVYNTHCKETKLVYVFDYGFLRLPSKASLADLILLLAYTTNQDFNPEYINYNGLQINGPELLDETAIIKANHPLRNGDCLKIEFSKGHSNVHNTTLAASARSRVGRIIASIALESSSQNRYEQIGKQMINSIKDLKHGESPTKFMALVQRYPAILSILRLTDLNQLWIGLAICEIKPEEIADAVDRAISAAVSVKKNKGIETIGHSRLAIEIPHNEDSLVKVYEILTSLEVNIIIAATKPIGKGRVKLELEISYPADQYTEAELMARLQHTLSEVSTISSESIERKSFTVMLSFQLVEPKQNQQPINYPGLLGSIVDLLSSKAHQDILAINFKACTVDSPSTIEIEINLPALIPPPDPESLRKKDGYYLGPRAWPNDSFAPVISLLTLPFGSRHDISITLAGLLYKGQEVKFKGKPIEV